MIPFYLDEISSHLAGTDFTLRLHGEITFYPGKAGQVSTWYLFTKTYSKVPNSRGGLNKRGWGGGGSETFVKYNKRGGSE